MSAGIVLAQRTTGTIRGVTRDSSGPVPGVVVTASNVASGIKYTATTQTDGSFVILEVDPGEYEVTTSIDGFQDASGKVRVLVGQTATLEFTLSLKVRATEAVTVTAAAVKDYDLRTPEVSTNVTPEQIKELPQSSRNFLNFAALAPGVAVTADFGEDGRYAGATFRSGGQDARQVNVFIFG